MQFLFWNIAIIILKNFSANSHFVTFYLEYILSLYIVTFFLKLVFAWKTIFVAYKTNNNSSFRSLVSVSNTFCKQLFLLFFSIQMMVFRTLRGPLNMGNIVLLTCGLMFVAASMKEEATQPFRTIAKPGHIEEPLITERQSGNIKQGSHFCILSYQGQGVVLF
jgi:hypothetical protein